MNQNINQTEGNMDTMKAYDKWLSSLTDEDKAYMDNEAREEFEAALDELFGK